MLVACHKKSYFDEISKLVISKYYVIFVYFQAAVSALLAVSVLYVEKNQNRILHNIPRFPSNSFSYDMPETLNENPFRTDQYKKKFHGKKFRIGEIHVMNSF